MTHCAATAPMGLHGSVSPKSVAQIWAAQCKARPFGRRARILPDPFPSTLLGLVLPVAHLLLAFPLPRNSPEMPSPTLPSLLHHWPTNLPWANLPCKLTLDQQLGGQCTSVCWSVISPGGTEVLYFLIKCPNFIFCLEKKSNCQLQGIVCIWQCSSRLLYLTVLKHGSSFSMGPNWE